MIIGTLVSLFLLPLDYIPWKEILNLEGLAPIYSQSNFKSVMFITTRVNNQLHSINKTAIYYCIGEGCYSKIFLENGNSYILSIPLKKLEEILPSDVFFRCHHSYIVNLLKISSVNIVEKMIHQKSYRIPISERKFSNFLYKCKHLYNCSEINWII